MYYKLMNLNKKEKKKKKKDGKPPLTTEQTDYFDSYVVTVAAVRKGSASKPFQVVLSAPHMGASRQ